MISRIEAEGYRCFRNVGLDIKRYQVFVGPNGSGKSTLLEIPTLIGEMVERNPANALLRPRSIRRGPRALTLREVVNCHEGPGFRLAVEAELPLEIREKLAGTLAHKEREEPASLPQVVRYDITLEINSDSEIEVSTEALEIWHGIGERQERMLSVINRTGDVTCVTSEAVNPPRHSIADHWEIAETELALSNIPRDRSVFPAANFLRELLGRNITHYEPDLPALRQTSPPGRYDAIDSAAIALPWFVLELQRGQASGDQRLGRWLAEVRNALPNVYAIMTWNCSEQLPRTVVRNSLGN